MKTELLYVSVGDEIKMKMKTELLYVSVGDENDLKRLFLFYINDLPNCLTNCRPRMYAGDTHSTYAGVSTDNIESCLNNDLAKVHNWLTANKLTLNTTKTEFMLIGSRQRLSTLTNFPRPEINGAPIDQVANAKSLAK